MYFHSLSLSDVEEEDLQALVSERRLEGKGLEFKREKTPRSRDDKKAVLDTLVGFANTRGGDIILGLDEDDGRAGEVCGMTGFNVDDAKQRWNHLIRDSIRPSLPPSLVEVEAIDLESGAVVIVIRIGESSLDYHRNELTRNVVHRTSSGNRSLRMTEIVRLIQERAGLPTFEERMAQAKTERLDLINDRSNLLPVPLRQGPFVALHLYPMEWDKTEFELSPQGMPRPPLFGTGQTVGPRQRTGDGLVATNDRGDGECFDYTHLSEEGYFEAVSTQYFKRPPYDLTKPRAGLVSPDIGGALWAMMPRAITMFEEIGATLPLHAHVSLVGVEGYLMNREDLSRPRRGTPGGYPERVELPAVRIDSYDADEGVLFETVDRLYYMGGRSKSYLP